MLAALQPALAAGARTVTVAVHGGHWVSAVWPGFVDTAYGIAIDVGSTTVAGHLCDLATGEVVASAGIMNPQIRFGEDLMSRVSYVMMHDEGAARAHRRDPRRSARGRSTSSSTPAGIERDRVVDVVLVGNPIMHHLVLGIDPTPLGTAPFTLATDEPIDAWADDIELDLPNAHLHVLPCIAGHVGADTAAAVLQEGPHRGDDVMLLVDVGTNAEIVLGNRERLFAASSPTGPAFEGAQLSCGPARDDRRDRAGAHRSPTRSSRASRSSASTPGRTSPASRRRPRAVDVTGVCGSGRDRSDRRAVPRRRDPARRHDRRRRRRALAARRAPTTARSRTCCTHGPAGELRITQNDVRAIQLAKAALNAGVRLLMDHAGDHAASTPCASRARSGTTSIRRTRSCSASSPTAIPRSRATSATRRGAARSARCCRKRPAPRSRASPAQIVKIETAIEPAFQAHFVRAMGFPDSDDARAAPERGARPKPRPAGAS